jgi:hypothetical protein
MTRTARAIIRITTYGKHDSRINYGRRMYAIIRKYTPDVVEGSTNECYADLTGLRTFFKMSYSEIAEKIKEDLSRNIGIRFVLSVATVASFEKALMTSKKSHNITTYKEMNKLFAGTSVTRKAYKSAGSRLKRRFGVPFIGVVS